MTRQTYRGTADAALDVLDRHGGWCQSRLVAFRTGYYVAQARGALRQLRREGYVEQNVGGLWRLTAAGREVASASRKYRERQVAVLADPPPSRPPPAPRPRPHPALTVATTEQVLRCGRTGRDLFGVQFLPTSTEATDGPQAPDRGQDR